MKLPHFLYWLVQLSPEDRRAVVGPYSYARPVRVAVWRKMDRLTFSVYAIGISLSLLPMMPTHPMAIPAAIGAGISFTILGYAWLFRPAGRSRPHPQPPESGWIIVVEVGQDGTARFVRRRVADGSPERFKPYRPGGHDSTNVRE